MTVKVKAAASHPFICLSCDDRYINITDTNCSLMQGGCRRCLPAHIGDVRCIVHQAFSLLTMAEASFLFLSALLLAASVMWEAVSLAPSHAEAR